MKPTVSVLMAVYNGERFLAESIDSVLKQTFSDFECIIVDDASSDATSSILSEYAQKDARVKIVTNEKNLGLTASLNKGIFLCVGKYIARMDADDIALPERIAKQALFLESNVAYGLVGGWAHVINDRGERIDTFAWETEDRDIRRNLIKYNCIIHPLVMFRRSVLDQVGLYDETFRYAQDYDLFFRIVRQSKAYNIPEILLKYRVSSSSITGSKNRAQAWCALRARWNAIRSGTYSPFCIVYLLRPLIGMIIPLWLKRMVKKAAL